MSKRENAQAAGADRILMAWAAALLRQSRAPEALEAIEGLWARRPEDFDLRALRAAALAGAGDEEAALSLYEAILAGHPEAATIWLAYGHVLAAVGRGADAAGAYRRGVAVRPGLAEAYWSLANLKTVPFDPAEIDAMRDLRRRDGLPDRDLVHLDFALARAAEDAGDAAGAFAAYAAANARRRRSLRYDPERVADHVARSKALFTRDFFAARRGRRPAAERNRGSEAIFIVGLPRSGSTLIEQILASHGQVEATAELPDIALLARRLGLEGAAARPGGSGATGYPEILADLTGDDFTALGETYLAGVRPRRRDGRPVFIDKAPNNFFHLGLIRLALPGARIVDARRGAMACCVACFRQHFARGGAFTYDLAELGRYYADYVALMDHFDAVLPGEVARVVHEDLVADPEGQIARLLGGLGLPFEPACLAFHQSRRAVRTPSAQQVRRPISDEGLHAWRAFEPWLEPLESALGPLAAARSRRAPGPVTIG